MAPVPEEHLLAGVDVVAKHGKVAFGSRAWEVFRELDAARGDTSATVYIYASHSNAPFTRPTVSWRAKYIGHCASKGGAHPEGMTFRPLTTHPHPSDNKGHWAVFWEVVDLTKLAKDEQFAVADLIGYGQGKPYKKHFIPEGPLLVEG